MNEDSFTWSGRCWLATSLFVGVVASAAPGCSSKSNEFRNKPRNTGGTSGTNGEGGTGAPSGGTGGSAEGGSVTGGSATGGSATGGRAGSGGSQGGSSGDRGRGGGDTGGVGGTAGTGGNDTGGGGASDGGSDCGGPVTTGEARNFGRAARSSGWTGTDAQYSELYNVPCASIDDCLEPCADRGGSDEMCEATECVDSTTDYCLPPTVWRNLGALRAEGTAPEDGAVLTLVFNPYEDFLLVTDFRLEVPAMAEITGIIATIRRAGGSSMEASDGAVRLIKGGIVGQSDRARPTEWTGPEYVNVDYGGATDLWGESWTPADVNSPNFGVALSAIYTDTAGNGRAYVDIVYVTVHYRTTCE